MAAPVNTHVSTAATGNREGLTNIIDMIAPTDTIMYSASKKTTATATFHEWQTQALRASAANAHAEGDDSTATAVTPQERLGNRTQILKEVASVSGTQEEVNKAGQQGEMSKQMALKSAEMKLDLERAIMQSGVSASGATRLMRGVVGFMVGANVSSGVGYVAPNYGAGNTAQTDGAARAFTEALLKDTLQKCYVAGGRPNMLMMGPTQKQTFSTFTGNATRQKDAEDKRLVASIDVYVSDFGTLKAAINLQQRSRDVFALQTDKWEFAVLRPWESKDLAVTGDSKRKQLVMEGTLVCTNPRANGGVLDVL